MAAVTEQSRPQGRPLHPGKGEKRGRTTPRGRQVDPEALSEIRALLGDRPRRRDLLIEFLHLIQDRWGHISAQHLAALAEELRLPQAEAFEVATFYHHFDVVKEGETPPPPVTVRVCDSLTCAMFGAQKLLAELEAGLDPARVRVVAAPCMGACSHAPAVMVGKRRVEPATAELVKEVVAAGAYDPVLPEPIGFEDYVAHGGYQLYRRLAGLDPHTFHAGPSVRLLDALNDSGLRGLGGAGFPTGRKWEIVRSQPAPRYMCVNADEGEPGTFKDRYYLRRDPHRFLEGALCAAHSIEAERVYIYLRDEYPAIREILLGAIARIEAEGLVRPGYLELRRGAGAYICGEESAMIESIEGKRGLPRHRPPYVAQVGLFGRPTLVNNVETLFWVRDIVEKGPAWFAQQGRHGSKGLRSYSVSGRVMDPGVKLAPAGITVRELIDEFCGGMAPGHRFRAYLPGGASGGILPASMADIPLDFGKLEHLGCFVGSHAVVVLSDKDDLKEVVRNLMRFFEDESCGQCTPCRVGTEKAVKLMQQPVWDTALLAELSRAMTDASICGLGQAASNPLKCLMKYFPEEFAA
ncbi:NAD(P)H-dependent oxidoreductase subunit E [Benzoatithermus flavus]|uniref:NAD(P)H-dependent oxidoreductase subunit E n=1 Tax=Benzoatithermus flavus TaxID=3108223 RepID=A0ABU8XQ82_9PROT